MKLLVANAALTLLLTPSNAKPRVGQTNLFKGDACDYGTRFLQCRHQDDLLCGTTTPLDFDENNYHTDGDVRAFYSYVTGKRFSTAIIRGGKLEKSAEVFDPSINGPKDPKRTPYDSNRGFEDYQICQGEKVKAFGGMAESSCRDYCLNESRQPGAQSKYFCCQHENDGKPDPVGLCNLFKGVNVQRAEHDHPSICISSSDCGTVVRNNQNRKWRCDAWTPQVDKSNYKKTLDITAYRQFDKDMADSVKDSTPRSFEMKNYRQEPIGWTPATFISLEKIGLSSYIRNQLEISGTKISNEGCGSVSWCTNKEGDNERRTCALDVTFKIKNGNQVIEQITESCRQHEDCENWNNNGDIKKYIACPQIQCPAYTYRAGLMNVEQDIVGDFNFRSGEKLKYEDGVTEYRVRAYKPRDVQGNNNKWDSQPQTQINNKGDRFYPVIVPFMCKPEFCDRDQGKYVYKGNTDTGQVWVEDEGERDPNDNSKWVKRIVIPPRYISTFVEEFDSNGFRLNQNQVRRNPSANQGRCGQCQEFEIANNREPVMSADYLMHDELHHKNKPGVLADEYKDHFQPPIVAFVSKGCTRCPEYLKRDDRRSLSNGQPNPNYGYCYRQDCKGTGILVQNGNDQGECQDCPPGKVVKNGFCRDCLDYETAQRNGRTGVLECVALQCRVRFYNTKQGQQLQCPDYLTTTLQRCKDQCFDPQCYSLQNGRNLVTRRDGTCGGCSTNQMPDPDDRQNRRCMNIPCGIYERRQTQGQFIGECRPDVCQTGYYNLRDDQFIQGRNRLRGECVPCGRFEENTRQPLLRDNRIFRYECRACGNNQIFTNGRCQGCASEEFAVNNVCVCDYYNRKQNSGVNRGLCRPDDCDNRSRIVRGTGDRGSDPRQGTCEPCPQGQISSNDRRTCQDFTCPRDQIKVGAACRPCSQPYQYPTQDQSRCEQPDCTNAFPPNSKYNHRDGTCKDCPAGQIVLRPRQRDSCNSCTCNSFLDIQRGRCEQCGNRATLNARKDQCIDVICNSQEIYTQGRNVNDGNNCPAVLVCKRCQDFTRAQNSNTICGPDPCAEVPRRGRIRRDGTCLRCNDYEIIINGQCQRQVCGANAYLGRNGECITCQRYQEVVGAQGQESCQDRRCYQPRYFLGGPGDTCILCPSGLIPTANYRVCVSPNCPGQEISSEGICVPCPDYFRFNSVAKKCENPNCRPPNYVTREGICRPCQPYTSVSGNGKDCIPCQCNDPSELFQVRTAINGGRGSKCMLNGLCQDCPQFTRLVITGANARRTCARPLCQDNQIITIYGTCESCPPCERLNSAKTKCVRQQCNGVKTILQENGTCKTCSDYQYINKNLANFCGEGDCDRRNCPQRNILLRNGACQLCPPYMVVSPDGYTCLSNVCTSPNEIIDESGICRPCDAYYRPDALRRTCINTCPDATYINLRNGECKKCARYFRADALRRGCIRDQCNARQFFNDRGICQDCKVCTRALPGNEQCAANKCSTRQILTSEGTCQDCLAYTRPSAVNTCGATCISCTPKDNEYITEEGFCKPCDAYTRAQNNNRVCGPDICDLRSKLMPNGRCQKCGDYSRGNGREKLGLFIDCAPDRCTGNQVLQKDGTCSICDNYQKANADNSKCIMPQCMPGRKILLISAEWKDCEAYTRADEKCRVCRPDPCTINQKLMPDGTCSDCPAYQRADETGKACMEVKCFTRTKTLSNGNQEDCPPFMHSSKDCRKCLSDVCTTRQRLLDTGYCEDCELYTRAQGNGRQCAPNICTQRQKLLEDGTCEDCKDFTRAFYEGKRCGNTPCTAREILQIDGRCAPCYPYTRASEDGRTCVPHGCTDRQRLTTGGQCADCPAYTRAQGDGTKCGPDACNLRQRILEDGTCQYCPLYSRVCKDQRCCDRPKCQPYQVLYKDGTCQECAFHEMVDPIDGTRCVIDPTKKVSDPIPAPTVQLQAAVEPACCTTAGCDVWSDDQLLAEDQASGFYLNQNSGNLGFILGNANRLKLAAASIVSAVLIAVNAI